MFKKFILLNLIYIFSLGFVLANSDEILDNLELQKYGKTFEYESLSERLNRLETDYFGMSQSGDLDDRLNKLAQISMNNKTYPNVYPYENQSKKKNVMKSFWDNFSSVFESGRVTGYTPPMSFYQNNSAWENVFRQQYWDYMNNSPNHCPYHNRYHHTIPNRLNPNYPYGAYNPHNYRYHYTGNYPINRYYQPNFYSPPNIYTRTGVHIIND